MICGLPHKIIYRERNTRDDNNIGRSDSKDLVITIDKDTPPEQQEATLIHEWVHLVLGAYGVEHHESIACVLGLELYRAGFRPCEAASKCDVGPTTPLTFDFQKSNASLPGHQLLTDIDNAINLSKGRARPRLKAINMGDDVFSLFVEMIERDHVTYPDRKSRFSENLPRDRVRANTRSLYRGIPIGYCKQKDKIEYVYD
jgi:hypothetical protein